MTYSQVLARLRDRMGPDKWPKLVCKVLVQIPFSYSKKALFPLSKVSFMQVLPQLLEPHKWPKLVRIVTGINLALHLYRIDHCV